MSFDEEWQQHKDEVSMRLNGLPAYDPGGTGEYGGGPGTADYIVHADDLGRIGHDAFLLFNGMDGAGKHAQAGSEAAATALKGGGFDTGNALAELNKVWDTQVTTLKQACAHISNHLEYSAKTNQATDQWIETSLKSLSASKINDLFK
ncbi:MULTISPECIES: hypothetical protein [unclassified Streptomyces]|uniref:hypothetical protein n=1 Tax=unclassified Streptomyces TaxID=2593676 RepID=UPI002E122875|nr:MULTISPECIES: hypothetical protein [unclassified Streptomyces]WSR26143.1 hypothetical protein OG573_08330 [Streptomyces sp. NBC_01205]